MHQVFFRADGRKSFLTCNYISVYTGIMIPQQ